MVPPRKKQRLLIQFLKTELNDKVPASLIEMIDKMLILDPEQRLTAKQALDHRYFKEEPLACEPINLPKLQEDFHEYSVKQEKRSKPELKKLYTFKPMKTNEYWINDGSYKKKIEEKLAREKEEKKRLEEKGREIE